jgi:hypothetical protein
MRVANLVDRYEDFAFSYARADEAYIQAGCAKPRLGSAAASEWNLRLPQTQHTPMPSLSRRQGSLTLTQQELLQPLLSLDLLVGRSSARLVP